MDPSMQQTFFKSMNGMDGNMVAAQMNGGMRPPSSHPTQPFNGPQMMARQQGGPQGPQQMQWQGQNGNGMAPQGPQGPQGPVQGAQQHRAMPPPSAPAPNANANGRTSTSSPQTSNAAPPTPQQSTKAAPKAKKDTKGGKKVSPPCATEIYPTTRKMLTLSPRFRRRQPNPLELLPRPRQIKSQSFPHQPLLSLLQTLQTSKPARTEELYPQLRTRPLQPRNLLLLR
jgi:hypothetical protein